MAKNKNNKENNSNKKVLNKNSNSLNNNKQFSDRKDDDCGE